MATNAGCLAGPVCSDEHAKLKTGPLLPLTWVEGEGWEKICILGRDWPRISAEFLAQQERELGLAKFRTEYCGEFLDDQEAAFGGQLVEACLVDGSDWGWCRHEFLQ
jgi:hypothetical protein